MDQSGDALAQNQAPFDVSWDVKVFGGARHYGDAMCAFRRHSKNASSDKLAKFTDAVLSSLNPRPSAILAFVAFSVLTGFLFAIVSLIVLSVIRRRRTKEIASWKPGATAKLKDPLLISIFTELEKLAITKPAATAQPIAKAKDIVRMKGGRRSSAIIDIANQKACASIEMLGIQNTTIEIGDGMNHFTGTTSKAVLFVFMLACEGEDAAHFAEVKCGASESPPDAAKRLNRIICESNIAQGIQIKLLPPGAGCPTVEAWNRAIDELMDIAKRFEPIRRKILDKSRESENADDAFERELDRAIKTFLA
ncbi:MAG: hypothetical protein LBB38_01480 [Puniceicoccales bacterium]|jgi:hypothetical protein|nr:hypothetical protein [Puniceicoccales bacterium]